MPTQEELFDAAAAGLLAADPAIERGPIFNADGLRASGKFFGFVSRGDLVCKLPAARVAELISSGAGSVFDAGRGRPMREWVRLQPVDASACGAYLVEARDFVGGRA